MTSRVPAERYVEELLSPWPEERHRFRLEAGAKHYKLLLDGRLVLTVPRGANAAPGRRARNAVAAVRRALTR